MPSSTEYLDYTATQSFNKIVNDYVTQVTDLKKFYEHEVSYTGVEKAIAGKKTQKINRAALVTVLKETYQNIELAETGKANIELLLQDDTFTICTAHQPNIFTGHLYFIYKILHAIKLAENLKNKYPAYHFVPVFYMGSEDADLEELGHVNILGATLTWHTKQKGAVGRMIVDDALVDLVDTLEGEFSHYDYGKEIITILKNCYTKGSTIQQATLLLVNELFGKYGLLVLIADHPELKKQMISVFKNDILENTSSKIVAQTSIDIAKLYKSQAHSRDINLFYLKDDIRERIELTKNGVYQVVNTNISFSQEALLDELTTHPENFSPNVILRGLFQETIMPNIAFIGGGGELAYWLQLKTLFHHYKIPYPILVLRNSFTIINTKQEKDIAELGFTITDLFKSSFDLETTFVKANTQEQISLQATIAAIEKIYEELKKNANSISTSLNDHVAALKAKQIKLLEALEKKMLRAEKRNHKESIAKIHKLKNQLFPNNGLQERVDNIIPYYAKYGSQLIEDLYQASLTLEQRFCILKIGEVTY
jgi:bacillithiol synthase